MLNRRDFMQSIATLAAVAAAGVGIDPDPEKSVAINSPASFVPELWSDEILASYKANLVFRNAMLR